jgi:hypothetical protein
VTADFDGGVDGDGLAIFDARLEAPLLDCGDGVRVETRFEGFFDFKVFRDAIGSDDALEFYE